MFHKKFVLLPATALLATAVACSSAPDTPSSPGGLTGGEAGAAPDGSTLKVSAPTPQSPVNGAQPQTLTFVAGASTAQFPVVSVPTLTYEVEVMNAGGTRVCTGTGSANGNTVTISPTCTIQFDANHTWRMRARLGNATGPWSAAAAFRSPVGGYINGSEIYDPLYTGTTVGERNGGLSFINGTGVRFNGHDSHITYRIDTLQVGEMSVMVTGIDEGNPGDKTKIFSMKEGTSDLTDNDYRVTIEKRGRDYTIPGATTFRIITGDSREEFHRIFDGPRLAVAYSDELWYFWKFTWGNGQARLEVRENGRNGPIIYGHTIGTGGNPYRPVPHFVHLGGPAGRNGPIDASIPGAIYKNFWVSSRPRPNFPNE